MFCRYDAVASMWGFLQLTFLLGCLGVRRIPFNIFWSIEGVPAEGIHRVMTNCDCTVTSLSISQIRLMETVS